MTMDWHDFKGGLDALPAGAQWVQLSNGGTAKIEDVGGLRPGDIIRYYGPAAEPEPILPIPREAWESVVDVCAEAILGGKLVTLQHPAGYERCGLGIPAKRGEDNCHEYRPIVVLEWIADMVKAAK